jgi:hypothetical protein
MRTEDQVDQVIVKARPQEPDRSSRKFKRQVLWHAVERHQPGMVHPLGRTSPETGINWVDVHLAGIL